MDRAGCGGDTSCGESNAKGGAWGRTKGGYAVNLSGQGHVVCYNYANSMWDGMNVFTIFRQATPEEEPDPEQ